MNFNIYTDGACKGNPGIGSYAYVIYDNMGELWVKSSGVERDTTNNKMELTAAIESLRFVEKNYKFLNVVVFSDSAYVVNCFNQGWIDKWKENGWKTYNKKEVLNKEMWQNLSDIVEKTGAKFERVSRNNELIKEAHKEAQIAIKKLR